MNFKLIISTCILLINISCSFGAKKNTSRISIDKTSIILENEQIQTIFSIEDESIGLRSIENHFDGKTLSLDKQTLFAIELGDGQIFTNKDFKINGEVTQMLLQPTDSLPTPALQLPGIRVSANLQAKKALFNLTWQAEIRDSSNYIRQRLILQATNQMIAIKKVIFFDATLPGASYTGTVLGAPLTCGNLFFGMEHPIAHSKAMQSRLAKGITSQPIDVSFFMQEIGDYGVSIEHGGGSHNFNIESISLLEDGKIIVKDQHPLNGKGGSNQYMLPITNRKEKSRYQLQLAITNHENATGLIYIYKKKSDILNFFVTRQDTLQPGKKIVETAVIGVSQSGQMRRAFQNYIDQERARPYKHFLHYNCWWDITDDGASSFTSEQLIERMHAWNNKLIKPYNVKLHSFVFDDGWDDMDNRVWGFHPEKFPLGFTEQAKLCKKYDAGIGVWMSPFGGYLGAQQQRIATAKREQLEVNGRGLSLAGKNYYKRFLECSLDMLKNYQVNYFKYDGFGGSEPAYLPDMEAGIRLISELRKFNPDVYINITAGTWPSPFWLRYADCTWRASGDLHQAGEGEDTQMFMTYRDGTLHNNIVNRSPLYPLNSIMTVGIAYANLGHPNRFVSDNLQGFKDMVRSSFSAGSSLQELYISHDKMKDEFWPILAEAIHWSNARENILEDTHWVGGSPINLEVYGFASWKNGEGVLSLRNPSKDPQIFTLDLAKILELQTSETGDLSLKSPWIEDAKQKPLQVKSTMPTTITLAPFQLLVWDIKHLK